MKDKKLYRRITVRLFPTPEQEELMWKHVHVARFVWNHMLCMQESRYKTGLKYMTAYDMSKELTFMRKEDCFSWINEVSRHSLELTCKQLDEAYRKFWRKTNGRPRYKKKNKCRFSFSVRADKNATYFLENNFVQVPKIGKIKHSLNLLNVDFKLMNPRIQYIKSSQKWILTFALECNKQAQKLTDEFMGIDLGVKNLAVVAIGDKKLVFHNINKSKRMRVLEKKKRHIKQAISRKYRTFNSIDTPQKGQKWEKSKNIEKYEQMLREIEAKMSNIRHDYIHKITRELVNMLPERVAMEDLNVRGMLKNKYLAKSISEQNFYFFIQCMKYKCEEYHIKFVQVPMFYPSSKLCSCCGYKKKDLKLSDREWTCPNCGTHHDRDYNAAINLMNYTEKQITTDKLVTKVERKKKKNAQKTEIVSVA